MRSPGNQHRRLFVLIALALLPNLAVAATTQPSTQPADLVVLEPKYPKPMFDGLWNCTVMEGIRYPHLEDPRETQPRQFMVPRGTTNLALGKPAISSDKDMQFKNKMIPLTDGELEFMEETTLVLSPGLQWVQIDLQQRSAIHYLAIYRETGGTIYNQVIVQVSDDLDFIDGVRTLFNNDRENSSGLGAGANRPYRESHIGRWIDAKGVQARYVRIYSNGNSRDEWNRYTEVEVYGLPAR